MNITLQVLATWIGIFVSIGTYLWRLSALNSRVNEMEKDLNKLGDSFRDSQKESREFKDLFREQLKEISIKLEVLSTKIDLAIEERKGT